MGERKEKTREIETERDSPWESDGFINLDPYKYLQFFKWKVFKLILHEFSRRKKV